MARQEGKRCLMISGHFSYCRHKTASRCSSACLSSELRPSHVSKKKEKSTVFPVVVHCLGSEVDWSTLCREWGIKGFITPWPAGLTPAPLWLWRGSEQSAAAGWSWIWPPGDWAGCGWNNRGGRPGRRWWAPPPHDPGRMSEGRSHRETRPGCCKRCSHATGIPTALETGNGLITDASRVPNRSTYLHQVRELKKEII